MISRKRADASIERTIAVGLITSKKFINRFQHIHNPELYKTSYLKLVAGWCLDYFKEYGRAPQATIQDIFEAKTANPRFNEGLAESIETFLADISDEYGNKRFHYRYALTQAEEYLQAQNLKQHGSKIQALADEGEIARAEQLALGFKQVRQPDGEGFRLFKDVKKLMSFLSREEGESSNLFKPGGDLGKLMGMLKTSQLRAFAAPEKRGKSFWLQGLSFKALFAGYNVAEFNLELSEEDTGLRKAEFITGAPYDDEDIGCLLPVFDCVQNQLDECELEGRACELGLYERGEELPELEHAPPEYKPCTYCRSHTEYRTRFLFQQAIWYTRSTAPLLNETLLERTLEDLRMIYPGVDYYTIDWPSASKTLPDIETQLDLWEAHDGFIPHVINIDYADLLEPDRPGLEYRHQLDNIWKGMKRLAQRRKALVLSATQTDKTTYDRKIRRGNVAEDKRKASHTDGMYAIDQTEQEEEVGIFRLSNLFERHRKRSPRHEVVVLSQLAVANPFLDAYYRRIPKPTAKK